MSKTSPDSLTPSEMAPLYVAGALTAAEQARFEAALARDPELAKQVAAARAERDEALGLTRELPESTRRALGALKIRLQGDGQTSKLRRGLWLALAGLILFVARLLLR